MSSPRPESPSATRGPRRVVVAIQSTGPGGMETYCLSLVDEFLRRGIEVTVIAPSIPELQALRDRVEARGARLAVHDTFAYDGRRLKQLGRFVPVIRMLRSLKPDVVHIHVGSADHGVGLVAASRIFTSATVVITEHDVPPERVSLRRRVTLYATDRLAHATVAVSRRNGRLRKARSNVRDRTFAAILNGIPVHDVPEDVRRENRARIRCEQDIDADALVIGCVVRLVDGKGLPDLIRAFALVRETHRCDLLLVGDGPLETDLRQLARNLQVEANVHFAGMQADPFPYYDAMDVFALAVPAGSMSIGLLEAMARGVPSVITFAGPEEAVVDGETGLSAPPSDPAGLAHVLERLLADGELSRRLGVAAADYVRRQFSMTRVGDDTLELYAAARSGSVPERLRVDA